MNKQKLVYWLVDRADETRMDWHADKQYMTKTELAQSLEREAVYREIMAEIATGRFDR